jgi:hypothetical protein
VDEQIYVIPGGLRIVIGEVSSVQHGVNSIILKGAVDVIL